MKRLGVFTSEAEARLAAAFLRRHGIVAGVFGHHAASLFPRSRRVGYRIELMALIDSEAERASALLAEMRREPMELDEGWEEQARPDLSRLDPSVRSARCCGCGCEFPLDGSVSACPSCAAELDFVECILATHGPDVLASCCDPGDEGPDVDVTALDLPCPGCGVSLRGTPERGACARCGRAYDKPAMLRTLGG